MSAPNWWGDWRPTLTPHTGDLQPTDLLECTMIVGGLPVNTVITGQQIIDGAGGGGGGAVGYYAQYQDDITQPLGAVNVGQPTKFRTMDFSNGVTVVSDTEITIANTGIYNLQFSFQFQNIDSQDHDVTIWLRKNGADVAGSAGFVAVVSSHGGGPGHVITSWNYILDAVGGDYYELYWSATSLDVSMEYYPAGSPPPATASAIFTVTQQAGIIAGTGMTALNGLSADVQTISTGTTGTDFNVVSSGSNHEFNIPTASATNRGALSTTDWTAFNGKQNTLVSGTNIKTVNNNSLLGSGNLTIGPRLMGYSGIVGTPTTGNAITICHSLKIPANTLGTNNILQLMFRMYRVSQAM
jgi:tetrahydromethanopterin S-methyltransferase subunit D